MHVCRQCSIAKLQRTNKLLAEFNPEYEDAQHELGAFVFVPCSAAVAADRDSLTNVNANHCDYFATLQSSSLRPTRSVW